MNDRTASQMTDTEIMEVVKKITNSKVTDNLKRYYIQSFLLNWIEEEKVIERIEIIESI